MTSLGAELLLPPALCCNEKEKGKKEEEGGKRLKKKPEGEASEPMGLYFGLRAARETKLALGAAPFIQERRWVEHNLPFSSWLGIKAKNLVRE